MLSHIDKKGNAKIVDISNKKITKRIAIASGIIFVTQEILEQIKKNETKKGFLSGIGSIAFLIASLGFVSMLWSPQVDEQESYVWQEIGVETPQVEKKQELEKIA